MRFWVAAFLGTAAGCACEPLPCENGLDVTILFGALDEGRWLLDIRAEGDGASAQFDVIDGAPEPTIDSPIALDQDEDGVIATATFHPDANPAAVVLTVTDPDGLSVFAFSDAELTAPSRPISEACGGLCPSGAVTIDLREPLRKKNDLGA